MPNHPPVASEPGRREYPNRDALLLALTERSLILLADLAERVMSGDGNALQLLGRWWDSVIEQNDQLVLPLRGGPAVFTAPADAARRDDVRKDVTLNDIIFFGTMLATLFHGSVDQHRIARRQEEIHLDGLADLQLRRGHDRSRSAAGEASSPGRESS